MAEYHLDSGLRRTETREFPTDKAAWEGLRALFGRSHSVYVTLFKKVHVPINRAKLYVNAWNEVYSKKLPENTTHQEDVIPIMWGLTRHKWGFNTENLGGNNG